MGLIFIDMLTFGWGLSLLIEINALFEVSITKFISKGLCAPYYDVSKIEN